RPAAYALSLHDALPIWPLGDVTVRKMVLGGTSMSSGTLLNYLPAHAVYRTPDMQHIYDGYFPTSTGATAPEVDVPMIQMPTMHEDRKSTRLNSSHVKIS